MSFLSHYKKSLKIPDPMRGRQSKRDRQWPKVKGQTMIYKTLHRKLKIDQHEPHKKNWGELVCSGRVGSSCSTSGTRRVTSYKASDKL